jgi:hypothetical protein
MEPAESGAPMTTKADAIEKLIDRGFKELLSMAADLRTKDGNGKPAISVGDLTKALEAATEWYKVKHGVSADNGFGGALKGGTVHDR